MCFTEWRKQSLLCKWKQKKKNASDASVQGKDVEEVLGQISWLCFGHNLSHCSPFNYLHQLRVHTTLALKCPQERWTEGGVGAKFTVLDLRAKKGVFSDSCLQIKASPLSAAWKIDWSTSQILTSSWEELKWRQWLQASRGGRQGLEQLKTVFLTLQGKFPEIIQGKQAGVEGRGAK